MQQKERKNREQEAIYANVINLLYDIINVISSFINAKCK